MHLTKASPVYEKSNLERLMRSSEAVSRAKELVGQAKHQIEQSAELVEEFELKKSRTELLRTTYKTGADERKAARVWAHGLKNDARRLRKRLAGLDRGAAQVKERHRPKRELKARDEAVAALKQTLSDLESVRMTLPGDPTLQELKADIKKAIARSEENNRS